MRLEKREEACRLRRRGLSLKEISARIAVKPGTISAWVREIKLTAKHKRRLQQRQQQRWTEFPEAMRRARRARWKMFRQEADLEFPVLLKRTEFAFGLGLYTGEGDKRSPHTVSIINYDPKVITAAMRFLAVINVDGTQLHCKLQLPQGLHVRRALKFWKRVVGSKVRFMRGVNRKVSVTSKGRRPRRWPNGGLTVGIHSVKTKQKLLRWMELVLRR